MSSAPPTIVCRSHARPSTSTWSSTVSAISVPSTAISGAGHDEQPGGAVHEQEAQVAPAVPEARELRLALARVVVDRDLLDLEPLLARADHHLGCELHPGRPQVEAGQRRAPDRAHAAVRVAHAGAEEEVEDPGEHRVPDVAVEPGHRAGLDALHAIAHHEVGALVELRHEARDVAEVVGEVGVGHHDVVALRGGEAGAVGAPVAAPRLVHHQGAGRRARARRCGRPSRCRPRSPRPPSPVPRMPCARL